MWLKRRFTVDIRESMVRGFWRVQSRTDWVMGVGASEEGRREREKKTKKAKRTKRRTKPTRSQHG